MKDHPYEACRLRGLTVTETAKECGVVPSSVSTWAIRNDRKFTRNKLAPNSSKLSHLTREQRRDYETLIRADYSAEEALAVVTRPKVKMRGRP